MSGTDFYYRLAEAVNEALRRRQRRGNDNAEAETQRSTSTTTTTTSAPTAGASQTGPEFFSRKSSSSSSGKAPASGSTKQKRSVKEEMGASGGGGDGGGSDGSGDEEGSRQGNPAESRSSLFGKTKPGDHKYHVKPDKLKAFPDVKSVRGKTPIQGGGGVRPRWIDKNGVIYEWDYRHGTIEKYTKKGKHLGEFCPNTGNQLKPSDPSRNIQKYL